MPDNPSHPISTGDFATLHQENQQLRVENQRLRALLRSHGIVDSPVQETNPIDTLRLLFNSDAG